MKFYEEVIKDFGGYDAAKKLAERKESALLHNIEGLKAHLLNYRRANNIFEVGDLVADNTEGIKKIYKIIEIQRGGIYKVSRFVNLKFGEFRHATPEEIKAGHRL